MTTGTSSGAQISLYPMTGDFVGVIMGALGALDPWRDRLEIETDDLSTLMLGPPEIVFPAMRDLFAAAARTKIHCVLSANVSRGCPPDPAAKNEPVDPASRLDAARAAIDSAPTTGVFASAQFAHYTLDAGAHDGELSALLEFIERSGLAWRAKRFCTRLDGDAGPVFAALQSAFARFGPSAGHVALDLTVSANSPSLR